MADDRVSRVTALYLKLRALGFTKRTPDVQALETAIREETDAFKREDGTDATPIATLPGRKKRVG